jgi:hypothetical protein
VITNFQEEIPVKKTLLILAVIAFATMAASAQTYSFWSASGGEQYCNYNVYNFPGGGVAAGYDDTVSVCGFLNNSPIVGFIGTVPNDGPPAHGKGVVVGDAIYDASADAFTGLQWTVFTATKYSKYKNGRFSGPYGWTGVAGTLGGTYFGDNYGFTTNTAPVKGPEVAGHTTAGKGHSVVKK